MSGEGESVTALLPECSASLQRELRCRRISFWGHDYDVTPALVDEVFGDGGQIIGFATCDSRPWYYVVRIDSGWSLDNWADGEVVCEHTDEIYEAIAGQFGMVRYECGCRCGGCDVGCGCGCECPAHDEDEPFPALNDSTGGCFWFELSPRHG